MFAVVEHQQDVASLQIRADVGRRRHGGLVSGTDDGRNRGGDAGPVRFVEPREVDVPDAVLPGPAVTGTSRDGTRTSGLADATRAEHGDDSARFEPGIDGGDVGAFDQLVGFWAEVVGASCCSVG